MKPVQLSIDELISELQTLRLIYGGQTPVEVYDLETWEILPFLALAYSEAPGSVLLLASDTEG